MSIARLRWLPAIAAAFSLISPAFGQQSPPQQYAPQQYSQQQLPQQPYPQTSQQQYPQQLPQQYSQQQPAAQPPLPMQRGPVQGGPAQGGVPGAAPQQPMGQQPIGQQPIAQGQPGAAAAPGQPQPMQLPPQFQLDPIRAARLSAVLQSWQTESNKVDTFRCSFIRAEYNMAFGPNGGQLPLFKNDGEVSFAKPDKGSFQITTIRKWQFVPPNQQVTGDWVEDKKAVGEHWVCDGTNVYEYRHDQKQLVVRKIPPQLQGKAIVDGPLPFLFGADANKLQARYWMREDETWGVAKDEKGNLIHPNEYLIEALPKFQSDAANYSKVKVVLDSKQMMPKQLIVQFPNNDFNWYKFDLANAKINNRWEQMMQMFTMPKLFDGWQRIDEPMDAGQAALPQPPAR